jgi:enoyl-CoA hydratase/carnithine racemase
MQDILISSGNRIVELRLNRPGKKNAITREMYAVLANALDAAAADPATRVVTIMGSGDCFTAGNDLHDFLQAPPLDLDQPVFRFLKAISTFPKPIVAGVHGPAVGIGTTMLLHCDLVLAAANASFSFAFVDLGLVPEAGSSLLLPRLIGQQRAARHMLLAEPFDAETARGYGLVADIVAEDALETRVQDMARRLSAKPPEAVQLAKQLLRRESGTIAERIAEEGEIFAQRLQSAEAREAFTAFFEKRPPNLD